MAALEVQVLITVKGAARELAALMQAAVAVAAAEESVTSQQVQLVAVVVAQVAQVSFFSTGKEG